MKKIDFELVCNINENSLRYTSTAENTGSIAEKVAVNDCPPFIIPFVSSMINGNVVYKYNVGNLLSIKYFDKNLTKSSFIRLVSNALKPFMNCEEWFMDYHSFCLDIENIYVDRNDMVVKYIYIFPDDKVSSDEDIKNYMRDLINRFDIVDDNKLQLELCHILLSNNFTISDIMNIIAKYEKDIAASDSSASRQTVKMEAPVQPEIISHQTEADKAPQPPVQEIRPAAAPVAVEVAESKAEDDKEIDDIDALFIDSKPRKNKEPKSQAPKRSLKSLFRNDKKSVPADIPLPVPELSERSIAVPVETVYDDNADETTRFIGADDSDNGIMTVRKKASLILVKSEIANVPKKIPVSIENNEHIIIGRESKSAAHKSDYELPATAKAIGRQHVRIEKKDDKYYIIDLATVNHTYLNGQMIFANRQVELENEALITFGSDVITYKFTIS